MNADAASGLPPEAFAVALASLPSMGPARLRTLLAEEPPALAWERANHGGTSSARDSPGPGSGTSHLVSRCSSPGSRHTLNGWRTTRMLPPSCSVSGIRRRSSAPRRWRSSGRARRRATASVWPRSSGPTSPPPVSAWCRGWRSASTGLRTRAPATPARRPSASWRAASTAPTRNGTSGCGGGWRRRVSSCPSPRPGCRQRSGAFRSAIASWPR